jgi:glycerol-3-phosphate acyltransferase PlsX
MNRQKKITLSVDCMGGDNSIEDIIGGVRQFCHENNNDNFLLHGNKTLIAKELDKYPEIKNNCKIKHCDKIVQMEDKPSQSIRGGKNSSMWNTIESVKKSKAEVAISCGNTGSLMAISTVILRRLPNVKRPAIAIFWPSTSEKGFNVVLDAGADIKAQSSDLLAYAKFGSNIFSKVFNSQKVKVGLLNVGTETHKGNEQLKKASEMLTQTFKEGSTEYVGFVEGSDFSSDKADVIVTDGFSGNIALKTAEGTANLIKKFFMDEFSLSLSGLFMGLLMKKKLRRLKERMDPRTLNGGVFVGLNGLVIKSHGSSDSKSFYSALKLAKNMSKTKSVEHSPKT